MGASSSTNLRGLELRSVRCKSLAQNLKKNMRNKRCRTCKFPVAYKFIERVSGYKDGIYHAKTCETKTKTTIGTTLLVVSFC